MNLSTKFPKKRGAKMSKKRAKIAENRSKSASNSVDGFFGAQGAVCGCKTGRKPNIFLYILNIYTSELCNIYG